MQSEWSENAVSIRIEPMEADKIDEDVIADLDDYTDYQDLDEEGVYKIEFVFSAFDHQSGEIFKAVRPVIDLAEGSEIVIKNRMDFIAGDILDEVNAAGGEIEQGESEESTEDNASQKCRDKAAGEKNVPHGCNEVVIRGTIGRNGIEIDEILHNDEPFPNLDEFLEASRLYETIEMNFEIPAGVTDIQPLECNNEEEALEVNRVLKETTDFRPRMVKGKVLETGAMPDELAGAMSVVRYREKIKLFDNPDIEQLRVKRRQEIVNARGSLYRSCLMFFIAAMAALAMLVLWLLRKKPD